MPEKNNHSFPCPQDSRFTKLETRQETIQREIKELKEVDKGLQETINKLDKTVTKFSTVVENLLNNSNTSKIDDGMTIPWWYAIIVGVAVYLITHLIDIL